MGAVPGGLSSIYGGSKRAKKVIAECGIKVSYPLSGGIAVVCGMELLYIQITPLYPTVHRIGALLAPLGV